jgi:hypothetical protein
LELKEPPSIVPFEDNITLSLEPVKLVSALLLASSAVIEMLNAVPAICGLLIVEKAKCVTVPGFTVKVMGFPVPAVNAPPEPVAAAVIVTDPARFPVTVSVATPATAVLDPNPVTLPAPAVCAKVTLKVLSVPVVTVFPPAS